MDIKCFIIFILLSYFITASLKLRDAKDHYSDEAAIQKIISSEHIGPSRIERRKDTAERVSFLFVTKRDAIRRYHYLLNYCMTNRRRRTRICRNAMIPRGDTGSPGPPGPQGYQGSRGLPGPKGEKGDAKIGPLEYKW